VAKRDIIPTYVLWPCFGAGTEEEVDIYPCGAAAAGAAAALSIWRWVWTTGY